MLLPLSLLFVTACGPSVAPATAPTVGPGVSAPPAQAALPQVPPPQVPPQAVKLPVVYNNFSIGMVPLWLPLEAGIFAKHGLDVTFDFAQGTLATQAMVNGQYDVGNVSGSAVVASVLQGVDMKMVAAVTTKSLYALIASRDVANVADLRGKAFGISKFGDSSDTATRLILRKLGLDPGRDVSILQVGNSPERYAALVAGSIQAAIADPMDVVRAERDGFTMLADQEALGIDYAGTMIAVRDPFLQEQPAVVRQFVLAVVEGIHYYKTHPDEAVAVGGKYLQSDDTEAMRSAVQVFSRVLMPDKPFITESSMQPIMAEVAQGIPAASDAPLARFVDNSLLEELDRGGSLDALIR
jgi:NitT/TauT family transport system substrate-binding protein